MRFVTMGLEKIASPVKRFGLLSGITYGIDRFLQRVSAGVRIVNCELMVQPIHDKALVPKSLRTSLVVREIERGAPDMELMPLRPGILEHRLAQPTVCLGAYQSGELIAYMWLCLGPYQEDDVRCTLVPQPTEEAVFDFDLYVLPEHRVGLGFAGLWDGANEYLRKAGIRYTFSRVSRYNLTSRRVHERLGWKRVGSALFIAVGQIQLMFATVYPYLHLSLSNASSPRLRLSPDPLLEQNGVKK